MEEQVKQEERVMLMLTPNELEVVFRGLLELPSKFSLQVIQSFQAQLQGQLKKETIDESTNQEGV
jgi:hypothetical protein